MYISVDLGGTNTRVAGALSLESAVFVGEPLRHRNMGTYQADLQFIIDTALEISGKEPIDALGMGLAGRLNDEKTEIAVAKHFPDWVGEPLAATLGAELDCPVYLDTDAIGEGLGEAYYGVAVGDFHYIDWGTGIGSADIRRSGDEVRATRVDWLVYCKDWEDSCGGKPLEQRYGKPPETFNETEWLEVIDEFQMYLGRYVEATQPGAVVFGGGLAVRHADSITTPTDAYDLPLAVTQFGKNTGLVGALGLIRRGTG
ncbi:MAG TPA: ROK family protein [Candidatus Limnocylindria bacterium]|nr:ROK family protein [Candidatus Limnocylindria bacterium]